MVETTQVIERRLRGLEERGTETQRHASADDGELQVEKVAHRCDTATHQPPRALDRFVGGLCGGPAGDRLDRWTRRLGFETPAGTTRTASTPGLDDHVTDMARISSLTIQQFAVQDNATTHARRHHHRKEVVVAARRTLPPLTQCKGLCIAVAEDRKSGAFPQARGQRKVAPTGDVERRYALDVRGVRTGRPHTDCYRMCTVLATRTYQHLRYQAVEIFKERLVALCGVDTAPRAIDDRSIGGDKPHGELRAPDVDCNDDVHVELFSSTVTTDWNPILRGEFEEPYWKDLLSFVANERRRTTVYPPPDEVFRALHVTTFADTRVVILGQDPYHGAGQAHGLCFSVNPGVVIPPSLVNIFKELRSDLGVTPPAHGFLEPWARQGVLMLNATLTVRANAAASHQGKGWETFTDRVIGAVAAKDQHVVFILWGSYARKKKALILDVAGDARHTIIESAHPSPLSANNGFFGSKPFSRTNNALLEHAQAPIDWALPADDHVG